MTGQIEGQLSIEDLLDNKSCTGSCGKCVCRSCLYWWSRRCPYGDCYDDHRAKTDPYDKAHPNEPPRTAWSNWNKPGERHIGVEVECYIRQTTANTFRNIKVVP